MKPIRLVCLAVALVAGFITPTGLAQPAHAPVRNLFHELLGKSEAELDNKLETAWQHLFQGSNDSQRLYYPVGEDMAYIADIGSGDVRSEGMSYGMMIAVQLDKKAEFDRLWKWANQYMRHTSGPRRGYFAWHCKFDGTQLSPDSASDGEEWFAMALFFAAQRWGNREEGSCNYADEAQTLLRDMLHKRATAEVTGIFNRKEKQVVFVPNPEAGTFTDPSYHLPAFYELWARLSSDAGDRKFWTEAARTSRSFFQKAAHPVTGLMPEYAHFDGTPFTATRFGAGKGDFRFDAWRTLANVALDHTWFAADPWQVEQSNRVLRFLHSRGPKISNQFTLEGKPLSADESTGLIAMAAVAGLAADQSLARPFVQRLWDAPIPSGKWRYYDGLLYTLGLLQAGGRFQTFAPVVRTNESAAADPFEKLRQGMTQDQVRQLVGEPRQIKPFKPGELKNDVWVYQRVLSKTVDDVQIGTREVPFTNPLTGKSGIMQEPVYGQEFTTISEIIELLIIEGRLIQWKRKNLADRQHST